MLPIIDEYPYMPTKFDIVCYDLTKFLSIMTLAMFAICGVLYVPRIIDSRILISIQLSCLLVIFILFLIGVNLKKKIRVLYEDHAYGRVTNPV